MDTDSELVLELYDAGLVARSPQLEAILAARDWRLSFSNRPPRRVETLDAFTGKPRPLASLEMSSILAAGSFQTPPGEILEMEDWEIAPGCIRETVGTKQEKIAFSKPALCTGNGVKACEDLYFRVQTLSPGQTQLLEASANTIDLISVAEGKVRVKLSNEPAFLIGSHGMIKIRPGVGGSIRSIATSGDVVLHITTLML